MRAYVPQTHRDLHLEQRRVGQTKCLEITRKVIRLQIRSDKIPALISPIGQTTPFKQIRHETIMLSKTVKNVPPSASLLIQRISDIMTTSGHWQKIVTGR